MAWYKIVGLLIFIQSLLSSVQCVNFPENNNNYVIISKDNTDNRNFWKYNVENATNCVALSTSGISVIVKMQTTKHNNNHNNKDHHHHKNTTDLKEIDLIMENNNKTSVQIETKCSLNLKVVKISFNNTTTSSQNFGGALQFHFLSEEDSYRLVLVDLVVVQEHKEKAAQYSYFAFRDMDDLHGDEYDINSTEYGSSYSCSVWSGVDAVTETILKITDLQFQVTKDGKFFQKSDYSPGPIGNICLIDRIQIGQNATQEISQKWELGNFGKLSVLNFLVNIAILLGGCALIVGLIYGLIKVCPEKAKRMRKSVFDV